MQIDAKVEPFAQTLVDKMKSENSRLVVILLGSGVCKKTSANTFGLVITLKCLVWFVVRKGKCLARPLEVAQLKNIGCEQERHPAAISE